MRDSTENSVLVGNVVDLLRLDELLLLHDFDAGVSVGILLFDETNFSERACMDVLLPCPNIVRY